MFNLNLPSFNLNSFPHILSPQTLIVCPLPPHSPLLDTVVCYQVSQETKLSNGLLLSQVRIMFKSFISKQNQKL